MHEIVRRHLIEQHVDVRHTEIPVDQDNALTGLSVGYGHVYGYVRFTDAAFAARDREDARFVRIFCRRRPLFPLSALFHQFTQTFCLFFHILFSKFIFNMHAIDIEARKPDEKLNDVRTMDVPYDFLSVGDI